MRKKFFVNLLAVLAVVMVGSFRAFGLGVAHGPLAMLAAAAAPYAVQTKILIVIAAVYGLLQGIKKFIPVTGLGSVIFNVALSVLGVATVVQPQDLFSTQTLTTMLLAVAGAAGVHGTVRSFSSGGNPGPGTSTTQAAKLSMLAFAALGIAVAGSSLGCARLHNPGHATPTPIDQVARNTLATSSGVLNQAQKEYLAECSANPTTKTCTLINQAGSAQNAAITAVETYCGFPNSGAVPSQDAKCVPLASAESALVAATANLQEIIGEVKAVIQPAQPAAKQ